MKETSEKLDFDEIILYYARFLRMIGVLPSVDGNSHGDKFVNLLLFASVMFSSLVHWSMFVVYLLKQNVPDIDSICEAVIVTGIHTRYFILLFKRREYVKLVDACRDIWQCIETHEYDVILGFEQKIRKLFNFMLLSVMMINVLYSITAVVTNYRLKRENNTDEWFRALPYKWYVNDADAYWPGYEAVFALQFLIVINVSIIAASVDTATPFLMMLNSGYLRVLQERLYKSSVKEAGKRTNYCDDEYIISCTKLHQKVLSVCAKMESLTSIIFLVQLLCNGYNTSLIMIRVVNAQQGRYKYLPVLSLSLGQLFICQYAPDFLVDESKAVAFAAYSASVSWMRCRFGKLFTIIIARSQKPVQMTAGGIVNLSLERFGSMLTSVVSFFTVLRNFNG